LTWLSHQVLPEDEGCAAELAPRAVLFAAVTHAREENSPDPARKHLSITSVVCGLLALVRVWSMFSIAR
jgi:hypothetical protein